MNKILIVDDEKIIANSIATVLSDLQFSIDTVYSGLEAIRMLKSTTYQLVILDLLMADFGGEALLDWIKVNSPATIVIIMTAYNDATIINGLQAKGAALVIKKPFDDIFHFRTIVASLL